MLSYPRIEVENEKMPANFPHSVHENADPGAVRPCREEPEAAHTDVANVGGKEKGISLCPPVPLNGRLSSVLGVCPLDDGAQSGERDE